MEPTGFKVKFESVDFFAPIYSERSEKPQTEAVRQLANDALSDLHAAHQSDQKRRCLAKDEVIESGQVAMGNFRAWNQQLDEAYHSLPRIDLEEVFPELKYISEEEETIRSALGQIYLEIHTFFISGIEAELEPGLIAQYKMIADEATTKMKAIQQRRDELKKMMNVAADTPIPSQLKEVLEAKLEWTKILMGFFRKYKKSLLETKENPLCTEVLNWIVMVETAAPSMLIALEVKNTRRKLLVIEIYLDQKFSDSAIKQKLKDINKDGLAFDRILMDIQIKADEIRNLRSNLSELPYTLAFYNNFP